MINEYIINAGPYDSWNLPPVGAFIRTKDGRLYRVDEVKVETRDYTDSMLGYVYAHRIGDGPKTWGEIAKRRTRVYGSEIDYQAGTG